MPSKETSTLCIFILLMILLNKCRAKLPEDQLLRNVLFPETNGKTFNQKNEFTISKKIIIQKGEGESLISGSPLESDFFNKETQTQITKKFSNNKSGSPNTKNTGTSLLEKHFTNLNKIKTTSELYKQLETSTQSTGGTLTASVSSAPICNTPGGVRAHESDCRKYYNCSSEGSLDGSFHLITKICPERLAFNIELNRCSRDISSCPLNIKCQYREKILDPASNSSYYLCEPRLTAPGYHIFHVNCGLHEIYYWANRKCGVDLEHLPYHNWNQAKDIDIVKAELKLIRNQDKLKLKANEKLQQKNKRKAIENAKKEAQSFNCVSEGNFVSKIENNFYITCIKEKNTLTAISMQCGVDGAFYPEFNSCVYSPKPVYSSIDIDEED